MRGLLARSGLRWRLAAWVVLVLLVCTGISFLAVYHGTGQKLRAQVDNELRGDAVELGDSLQLARPQTPRQVVAASDHYVSSQPFAPTSTLLFTLTPGARTSTNRPELFSQAVPDNGESFAQQREENELSQGLLSAHLGYSTVTLTDVGDLRLLKRAVHLPGGRTVTVGVGEPLATVANAQAGVARAFILAGILALAGALLGAYLIGNRLTRPLRRMAAVAARVDAGDLHPRIEDPGGQGTEIEVLAEAFNNMLDRLTEAFAAQRAFVADASHELRTPLTVVAGQLEVLARKPDPSAEEVRRVERRVQAEIARIGRLVDDLLVLARSEQREFLRVEAIELPAYVSELWDGVKLLAPRRFELGPVPSGTLQADPDRLAQALRNLVSNAIEHTASEHGLVRLRVEAGREGLLRFFVEDDGPGISAEQRERVFDRFQRTDAARDRASGGAGLGLAIVRAIAEAHAGRVRAEESAEGGARIVLELGRFSARRAGREAPVDVPAKAAS
ncbi:MAG: sensor histidine kinase [Solirubrobacteraceae bacterium]